MALLTENPLVPDVFAVSEGRNGVVVAGPGTSLTVPGLIVSEIVQSLAKVTAVTRIEVDVSSDLMAGLHRAPSLAAAHGPGEGSNFPSHRAPLNARLRAQNFRDLIGQNVATALAYAWPGLDNSWIRQFIHAGRSAGALTVVACASLPQPEHARASSLARTFAFADVVLVGVEQQAAELRRLFGRSGPVVETHEALSLEGRSGRHSKYQITAFLPKDGLESLSTLLAAFDAIPEAWIDDYNLQVVMRYDDGRVPKRLQDSYHRNYVELIGDNISSLDLKDLFTESSALGIASPTIDSRIFGEAVRSGIGTVVFGEARVPSVGRGYVGGLLANVKSPSSLHVALNHALRLGNLRFPEPDAWDQLAQRLNPTPKENSVLNLLEPATND
jgi:hypothetical protein